MTKKHLKQGVLACLFVLLHAFNYAADQAVSVSAPTDVYAGGTFQVTVEYTADAQRDIAAYLFNTSTWVQYGNARTTVEAGSGTVTLNVSVTNPPIGTSYQWTGKVENVGGGQLSQVSQWCQVIEAPQTGPVTISGDYANTTGRSVNKRAFGLNVFQGFDPNVAGTPGNSYYKNNIAAIQPSHIRYHSWEMVRDGSSSWLDANGDWDANKIYNAMQDAYTFGPEILMNIPWVPDSKPWTDANGKLLPQYYDDFANWCAQLVQIVNIDHGRNVKYWELTNEITFKIEFDGLPEVEYTVSTDLL